MDHGRAFDGKKTGSRIGSDTLMFCAWTRSTFFRSSRGGSRGWYHGWMAFFVERVMEKGYPVLCTGESSLSCTRTHTRRKGSLGYFVIFHCTLGTYLPSQSTIDPSYEKFFFFLLFFFYPFSDCMYLEGSEVDSIFTSFNDLHEQETFISCF